MASKSANLHGTSRRDWLKLLDQAAKSYPQASSWKDYSDFEFMRYPHLRPPHSHAGFKALKTKMSKYCADLQKSNPELERVFRDLPLSHEQQLCAMLLDIKTGFDAWESSKTAKKVRREKDRRIRNLEKRVAKAQNELEKLHEYAKDLHRWLGSSVADVALYCAGLLGKCLIPCFPGINEVATNFGFDSVAEYANNRMVWLFWFFVTGCGIDIKKGEAEVRVALIRNALWTRYCKKGIEYVGSYNDYETKGCNDVRLAVSRHCR